MSSNRIHTTTRRGSGRRAAMAVVSVGLVVLMGCGTRVSREEILAAEAGGLVAVPDRSSGGSESATAGDPSTGSTASTVAGGPDPASGATAPGAPEPGAPEPGAPEAAAAAGCAQQGPPVVIGQVGGFSGLIGAGLKGAIQAPYVWVRDVNARGGLGCHPVEFIQRDDGSDPARSQAAVQDLAQNENAVALFSNWVLLNSAGFRAGVEAERIAAVGGDQVNPDWTESPFMFPVGGTARGNFAGALKGAGEAGGTKLAILYCIESTACPAFYNAATSDGFAQRYGMEVVYTTQISLTQTDFTAQCQNAKNAGADTLLLAGDPSTLVRTARSCANLNYFPRYPIAANQASFDPNDPNLRRAGAFLAAPVFPHTETSNQAEQEFRAAMERYAPSAPIDAAAAMTWAAGRMLEAAVAKLGPEAQTQPLTRELILQGLGMIDAETLAGLIPPTTYVAGQPQAENLCWYSMTFSADGTFSAPNGSEYECLEL